jgi:PTH2 family peptidyl-tRNA hydrolase
MRKGKMIAQGSHGVLGVFFDQFTHVVTQKYDEIDERYYPDNKLLMKWFYNNQKKICVYVNSEEKLLEIYSQCIENDLSVHLVHDLGLTEFNNKQTTTCLAIGPDYSDKIDKITGDLPLL